MRRLARLPVFDHRAIDADAAAAHVLERVAVVAHIHDLALLDAPAAPPLDILAADAAAGVDIGSRAQQGADLPDRQHILSERRIGEIAVLDEHPALGDPGQ